MKYSDDRPPPIKPRTKLNIVAVWFMTAVFRGIAWGVSVGVACVVADLIWKWRGL